MIVYCTYKVIKKIYIHILFPFFLFFPNRFSLFLLSFFLSLFFLLFSSPQTKILVASLSFFHLLLFSLQNSSFLLLLKLKSYFSSWLSLLLCDGFCGQLWVWWWLWLRLWFCLGCVFLSFFFFFGGFYGQLLVWLWWVLWVFFFFFFFFPIVVVVASSGLWVLVYTFFLTVGCGGWW